MPSRSVVERLKAGEVLLMDGGTGSEIQRRGVNINKGGTATSLGVWSASANIDAPGVVGQIHRDYMNAGAEIIISNNFYTTPTMLAKMGEEARWEEYTRRGGEIAVQARDAVNSEAYVAGGIAPPGSGDLREEFEGQSRVLAEAGVDFMIAEYVGGGVLNQGPIEDCVTAVEACATSGLPVFLGVSNVTTDGTMRSGTSFAELAEALKDRPVAGILLMCSLPEAISACMPGLRDAFDGPIGGYGHLGYGSNPDYGKSPEEPYFTIDERHYTGERYAEFGREWKAMGAQIIGGCCATAPRHIEALRPVVKG